MPDFLVTGATGTVGSALVRLLSARGATVRAMSRHPERGDRLPGVEPYAADLNDPEAVRRALTGVRRVFLLTGGPDGPRQDHIVAEAAAALGIDHLVKLSVLGIDEGADDPLTRWHREGEEAVVRSGVRCAFVRPGAFMSNALHWTASIAAADAVSVPFADLPVAPVDPVDIAAVAYHLLVGRAPTGAGHPVTGPEAISPRRQIAVLAELLDRPIGVTVQTPEQSRDQMVAYGLDERLADATIAAMGSPLHGRGQTPLPTVEQITGLPPRTFRDWAAANLTAFTAQAASR
ncbi:SDR family oxidoreductase [Actinoallomurus sp. CA-150999]|uniref:SDR family oxidoreductase n=1 Tax=Actinoallomurus sp. CA-150999 TaxID=3239887 RepID=UPI003D8B887D